MGRRDDSTVLWRQYLPTAMLSIRFFRWWCRCRYPCSCISGTKLSRPFYQLLHRKITLFVEMGGAAYSGGYEEVIYRGYFFAATSCSRSFFLSSILSLRSFETKTGLKVIMNNSEYLIHIEHFAYSPLLLLSSSILYVSDQKVTQRY